MRFYLKVCFYQKFITNEQLLLLSLLSSALKEATASLIRTVTTLVHFVRYSSAGAVIPCDDCVKSRAQSLIHFGIHYAAVTAGALFSKQTSLEQ